MPDAVDPAAMLEGASSSRRTVLRRDREPPEGDGYGAFMPQDPKRAGGLSRVLQAAGLKHQRGSEPRRSPSGARSRYGRYTSRRLDEDIDELVERIEVLEEALRRTRA